jgi:DNA-binding Xre family transcriptional regulator
MKLEIKEICEARGIKSAYELAKRTKLNMPTAYRAFANDIKQFTPQTLKALCDALECSPNDIFGYDEPQTVKPQSVKANAEKPASKPATSQTMASGKDLMTVADVMSYLSKSESSVLRYIKKYGLEAKKVGGGWKILRKDVEAFEKSDFYINEAKK